jgi:hypothetical protein
MQWLPAFSLLALLRLLINGGVPSFGMARNLAMAANVRLPGTTFAFQKKLSGLGVISIPAQNGALLAKFLSKLHSTSDAPWVCWFRRRYGWSTSRDLGDSHYLDTPIWKAIVAGLASFRLTSQVLLGDGSATAFWHDLWLGNTPLNERFPALFFHSTRPHASVSWVLSTDIRSNLGPRLSHAANADLRTITNELDSVVLRAHSPDTRVGRLTNKMLSNKDFYSIAFRHLQVDASATSVWWSAAPLKCKIFCWLAKRRRLPTNA